MGFVYTVLRSSHIIAHKKMEKGPDAQAPRTLPPNPWPAAGWEVMIDIFVYINIGLIQLCIDHLNSSSIGIVCHDPRLIQSIYPFQIEAPYLDEPPTCCNTHIYMCEGTRSLRSNLHEDPG